MKKIVFDFNNKTWIFSKKGRLYTVKDTDSESPKKELFRINLKWSFGDWLKLIALVLGGFITLFAFLSELDKRTEQQFVTVMGKFGSDHPAIQLQGIIEITDFFHESPWLQYGYPFKEKIRSFISANLKRYSPPLDFSTNCPACWTKDQDVRVIRDTMIKSLLLMGKEASEDLDLSGVFLPCGVFYQAKLKKCRFPRAILSGGYFIRADLTETWLEEAELSSCDFTLADLTMANLRGAILSNAFLNSADLTGATLANATLDNVKMREVKGLTIDQLSAVLSLYKAQLDPELMEQVQTQYPHLLEEPKEGETQ